MVIRQKQGNLKDMERGYRVIDRVPFEWYETSKRIMTKKSLSGREVVLKFLSDHAPLQQDDVLFSDETSLLVVDVQPCDVIELRPRTMNEMAALCYEIGNKHLPLFFEEGTVLVPFEAPLFRLLTAAGFEPLQTKRRLLHALRTTVSPHEHERSSLFSKILQLTT